MTVLNVGVIGYSGDIYKEPIKSLTSICLEIGKCIAKNNWILVNGGRNGVMHLVSKAAKNNGGYVIGYLPWGEEGNEYLTLPIKTGLDFNMRSFIMLKNVDAVVSLGGEIGTAIEILGAYSYKKPIILFRNTGGWTDNITKILIEEKYLDNRKLIELRQVYKVTEMEIALKEIEQGVKKDW